MQKARTRVTFCAEFPDDTEARKIAEELVNRLSEIRELRGGSLAVEDEHGDIVCEIAFLRGQ
jgi:hypothetical protein